MNYLWNNDDTTKEIRRKVLFVLVMKKGFLSQKEVGGVKEKNQGDSGASSGMGVAQILNMVDDVGTKVMDECPKNKDSNVVKNMKKPSQTHREVSKSNSLDVLISVENDVDMVTNGGTSNMASKKANSSGSSFWDVNSSSASTTPIVKKIDKMERLVIHGTTTLVDDEGKPLTRVNSSGDHDSEDEVASVDNDMDNFLASKDVSYGWDILDKIQDICDDLDIKVQGHKKK
nr:hypothetical protein [Tanacetum cinerariifolium]